MADTPNDERDGDEEREMVDDDADRKVKVGEGGEPADDEDPDAK